MSESAEAQGGTSPESQNKFPYLGNCSPSGVAHICSMSGMCKTHGLVRETQETCPWELTIQ